MRVIEDNDTETFVDASGDSLTLLTTVRHGDVAKCQEVEDQEVIERLKSLMDGLKEAGAEIKEIWDSATSATPEQIAAAEAATANDDKSPAVKRARLKALARGLKVGGRNLDHLADIMQAYDQMDGESAAWVDAQVSTVWARAVPGEREKNGEAAVPATTDEQGAAAEESAGEGTADSAGA